VKPERTLMAERPLARHDPALLRAGPGPAELTPALARAGERLARLLRGALAPVLGGEPPKVTCNAPSEMPYIEFTEEVGMLAGNSLYATGQGNAPLLSVIDADVVLRLVDRAFGGQGEAPYPLPPEFQLSAELMVARLEKIVAAGLASALGSKDPAAIRPLRREGKLSQLQAFADDTRVAVITLMVDEPGRTKWTIRMAFPFATLAELFGHGERPPVARSVRGPSEPTALPFAELPLSVTALLVDVALPLSAISRLEIGQVLAVPVARMVPLRVAGRTVAHGSIGAVDDRVAVQITQLS
jgi:flagellar motor switch protein FliM